MSRNTLLHFCGYSIIGIAMIMPLLVLPAMVGTLVDEAAMSESFAGWVAAITFAGGALAGLFMAFRMHRLELRRIAAIGLVAAIALELASAYLVASSSLFLTIRFATGLASGAAYTAALTSFARHDDVERGFGIFITLQFIVSGIGLYILPVYSPLMGAHGMFIMFAVIDAFALLFVTLIPKGKAIDSAVTGQRSERHVLFAAATVLAVLAYCLFEVANNAQFTYVERLAVAVGLSDTQIGTALLVASLVGIPGAFTIVLIGHRFGRFGPLVFGIAVAIAGLLLLIKADSYASYFVGSCFMGFSWAFCLPYLQSLLASLDRHGSALAAGSAFATVGGAAGPGIAATIVGDGNYTVVFLFSIAVFVATVICVAYVELSSPYQANKVRP